MPDWFTNIGMVIMLAIMGVFLLGMIILITFGVSFMIREEKDERRKRKKERLNQ